jgi:rhamnogalacturonyl hydrolase YesR
MKNNHIISLGVLVVAMLPMVGTFAGETMPGHPTVQSVKADMKRVADWQMEHLHDDYGRQNLKMNELNAWTYGALYVGMLQWAEIADNDSYYEWLKAIAVEQNWELCPYRFFHADDHVVGQLYLGLYEKYGAPEMIEPTRAQFDKIMAAPPTVDLTYIWEVSTDRWSWCDALFMAPPVWARLAKITVD